MTVINETSFRSRSLADTLIILNQYREQAGITRLADITHLDCLGFPVFTAIRPRAKSLSTSQGKGASSIAAKCSALMEAIEVYFAENISPDILNHSTNDLQKKNLSYLTANTLNKRIIYTEVKEKLNWVITHSALTGQSIYAPFPEFSLNSYLNEVLMYSPNTTGLAGGNSYEEALLHSVLEVIEREPCAFHQEVSAINHSILSKLSNLFKYKVIYNTNRYNIASFEVVLQSKNPFDNQVLFKGNGCHLNKNIALNRAITEAIQTRTTIIAGSRDDIVTSNYQTASLDWDLEYPQCDFNTIPDYGVDTINAGLEVIFKKAELMNQDIIVRKYHEADICILKSKIINRLSQ